MAVDFQLGDRRGTVRTRVEALEAKELRGPFQVAFPDPLPVDRYGSGHIWFFDAPVPGGDDGGEPLPVPIDEHRVRPGR